MSAPPTVESERQGLREIELRPSSLPLSIEAAAALIAMVIGLWMAFVVVPPPSLSDAYFDHEFITRVVDGTDPYAPTPGLGGEVSHPRPPGAILPMLPLALVDAETVRDVNNLLGVVAIVVVFWYSGGTVGILLSCLILLQPGVYQAANQMWWVGGLIVAGLAGRSRLSGLLVGVAAAIKLWPLAIIGAWVFGRNPKAWPAITACGSLTGAGLLFPKVSFDAFASISETANLFVFHTNNESLFSLIVRSGFGYGLAWGSVAVVSLWWLRHRTVESAIVLALLVTPLVWPPYFLPLVPYVASRIRRRRLTAAIAGILWYLSYGLLAAVVMGVAIEASARTSKRVSSGDVM